MRLRPAALLLAVFALAQAPPFAASQADPAVIWQYSVSVPAGADGAVEVEVTLLNGKDRVRMLRFDPASAPYPVSEFRVNGRLGTVLEVTGDIERFSYRALVNRESHRSGEFVSYLSASWGLIRAEALSVPFNYTFPAGSPPRWDARVTLSLPGGWTSSTPWAADPATPNRYFLPRGEALPKGFLALGPIRLAVADAAGREVRIATIGDSLPFSAEIPSLLAKSTPYLETVYGRVPGPHILVAVAPDPMLRGGLGASDSFYLHASADIRTAAHEWAHVWQRFGGTDTPGDASLWAVEGDAELHGTIALHAAGKWTLDEVNAYFSGRARPPLSTVPLAQAGYGATEDVTYGKGALVLAALDSAIELNTASRLGLPDLLQRLNEAGARARDGEARWSNAQLHAELNRLTGREFRGFFDRFVYGSEWPGWAPLTGHGRLVVVNLTVDPPLPMAGREATVRGVVDNRGLGPAAGNFTLLMDGAAQGTRPAAAEAGRRVVLEWRIAAPPEGLHDLRLGNATATFRVAAPAHLAPTGISTVPPVPTAGRHADLLVSVRNRGDFPAEGSVVLLVDGQTTASRNVTVGSNATSLVQFPFEPSQQGPARITVRVYSEGRLAALNASLEVGPPDRDGDGVPDHRDAYPDHPDLSEKGILADARNLVPHPTLLALMAFLAGGLLRLRRG